MRLLPLEKLGTRELEGGVVQFGIFLPWVSPANGHRLWVKVIHENDQFLQEIQPLVFEMRHTPDPDYGDYWSVQVPINTDSRPHQNSAWGTEGRYVYRYLLENPNAATEHDRHIDWIIDPFAREFGVGKLSAFTLGYRHHQWSDNESRWKTPKLDDLVLYELIISEFGGDLDKTIAHLDYLRDLGINCLQLMPVSNVANQVDWGYLPIGFFGVDERFGKRKDMQRLIEEAHNKGMAVIMDSVYGHTSEHFPYSYVYKRLGYQENPFIGHFAKDYFGESTDFRRSFTRDFFYTVNCHWLDCYHVDGFRYDCVPEWWDGPLGTGYAALTYETYKTVQSKGAHGHWQRFTSNEGAINLIQCAEQLEGPREVVERTYSNCTWQNETLGAAEGVARGSAEALRRLGLQFGLIGYPDEVAYNGDRIKKSAVQYIENHDHARFICNFKTFLNGNELLAEGDRNLWFKLQPYLIGLFTAKGIPMLWQGQEFGENYNVPDQGWGRVATFRPMRWEYFYDDVGKSIVALVRKLVRLRSRGAQFRAGEHFFYNDDRYISNGVLLFSRKTNGTFSLTALNFSDTEQTVPFTFPISGNYTEELHGREGADINLMNIHEGAEIQFPIPPNYGRVWTIGT
ncbi:MAG TPA: alpha-amlyase [Deltaproteobacteria bacterium]|nr:MAG: alpha-amlyase [Deltaproteobacteria bacterium GWA2_55_82]OGQ64415.1 MAG: alpha-amlyase [Deltaproteobacteria bacterium RIFCSPLOWO2_02_FULL_55_12]OIJ72794.1 MAG: alpha-amlyase [Deltaproteobacteria bacterium GWC2_55_46]HBG46356.1 alpha-amlyase [Deltaproteobacteria bacterium]HCY11569.1 alpha-amlyase [Deltaproteobacteria bacterium]